MRKSSLSRLLMKEFPPNINPSGIYPVKLVCAELGVSHKTFQTYRRAGFITPVNNPQSRRPKYTGQSIIDCWHKMMEQ